MTINVNWNDEGFDFDMDGTTLTTAAINPTYVTGINNANGDVLYIPWHSIRSIKVTG